MACRWINNNKGEIVGALTQSGERSKLFDDLQKQFENEKAIELFAVSESDEFQEIFGSNIKTVENEQSNTEYRNRRRWNPSRGNQTLEGAPIVEGATGADAELTYWAEEYAKRNGISYKRQSQYVEVDEKRAKKIAESYDKMEHNPSDTKVKEAFQNLINQTIEQYKILKEAGYKFWLFDETNDPYKGNPYNAMRDLRDNKKMGSFATEAGFGSGATKLNTEDNPMLQDTGIKWGYGSVDGKKKRVLANDLFRAVHDAFGHGLEGSGFRARGEENAWQAHARLFTGSALGAITTETRGQNSWLNYGKYGEQNRNAKVEETVFADQKTGLMPEWTWKEGFDKGVPSFKEPTIENLLQYVTEQNKTQEKLTKEHLVDLQDFSVFDREKLLKAFYDNNGMFSVDEDKLVKSGLYSAYEAGTIASDIELQATIKDSLERLNNTEVEPQQLNIEREVTNEFNSFGKLVRSEKIDENENVKEAEVFVEIDGEIRAKRNTETESLLIATAKRTQNRKVESLSVIPLKILQDNEQETLDVLNQIEEELARDSIDVLGLSEMPIDESLKDFLAVLDRFIKEPTAENTKEFADFSDNYFERDLESAKEKIEGEDTKEYVKLETNLSEEDVYNQQGLIKLDGSTYIKTASEALGDLYENVRTYTEKYPKDKTLEEHVQEQLKDYTYTNAETAEAIILYKMYFGVDNGLIKDKNGNLIAPNGKVSNLNEEQWKLVRTPEFKAWFGDWQTNPENASKVVDENGEPLVVYHGTNADFTEFQNRTGIRGNQFTGSREVKSDTFFFTDNIEYAEKASNIRRENFGGSKNIISSFLNIKKPLDFSTFNYKTEELFNEIAGEYPSSYFGYNDNLDQWWRLFDKDEDDVTNVVKEKGYNGVMLAEEVKTVKDDKGYEIETASIKSFGVFDPNQIKSATEIKGTTSEETNDIRFLKAVAARKQVSNFTGDYNYLTEEFPSDFYSKFLAEKKKNSKLFRNFYSNFEINEKGIKLIKQDSLSLQKVEIYADDNLRQYSLLSSQIPNLKTEKVDSIDNKQSKRDEAINNTQTIEKFKGQLFKLNNNEVILKNSTQQFIKVGENIYESVEQKGSLNHYLKIANKKSNYNVVGATLEKSQVTTEDFDYLSNSPELFISVKDYLKGDIEGFEC